LQPPKKVLNTKSTQMAQFDFSQEELQQLRTAKFNIHLLAQIVRMRYEKLQLRHPTITRQVKDGSFISIDQAKAKCLLDTRKLASSLQLNRVYLQESQHTGSGQLGVFAHVELEPGDLVTCYAADAVICVAENKQHCGMFSTEWRQTIPPHEHEQAMREGIDTMVRTSADFAIHSHRKIDSELSCVGQFVNDAYHGITQNPFLIEKEYEEKSNARSNCRYTALDNGLMIVIEATKRILPDQELLISYGFEHWRAYFQRQTSKFQVGQSNFVMTTPTSSRNKNRRRRKTADSMI